MQVAALKLLSQEFRELASRAVNSPYDHAQANLRHLLDFVAETALLRDAVESAPRPASSVEEVVGDCMTHRDRLVPVANRRENSVSCTTY